MSRAKLTKGCVDLLKKSGFEGEELKRIVFRLNRYLDNQNASSMFSLPQNIQDFVKQTRLELEAEIRNRANIEFLSLSRKKDANKRLDQFGDDVIEGFLSLFRGSNRIATGARLSIDAINVATLKNLIGGLVTDLEKAGVLKSWASGKRDREVIEAYYELLNKNKKSGDKEIDGITEVLFKWDKETNRKLNSVGARVELEPGGLFRGSVDSTKVTKAEFEGWKERSLKYLDEEQMRKDSTIDFDVYMKLLFEEQATGRYVTAKGAEDSDVPAGFLGSNAKLAKKVSRRPRLIFKDGSAHHDYIKEFGETGFHGAQSAIFSMEHSSRNYAMMEVLGPNPKKLVKEMLKERQDKLLSGTDKQTDKLIKILSDTVDGLPRPLSDAFKQIDGTTRVPGNVTFAKISAGLRIAKNMALLGKIVLRSVTDFATISSEARFQGMPWGQYISAQFKAITAAMPGSDAKEFARLINIGTESLQGTILDKFGLDQIGSGLGSQLQRFYFKLNGITFWNDTLKSAFALMGASHIGAHAHFSAKELANQADGKITRLLDIYGISGDEWDVMRHTVYAFGKNKNDVITPDRIAELPDEVFDALLSRQGSALTEEEIAEDFLKNVGERSALSQRSKRLVVEKEAIITRNLQQARKIGEKNARDRIKSDSSDDAFDQGEDKFFKDIVDLEDLNRDRKKIIASLEKERPTIEQALKRFENAPSDTQARGLKNEAKSLQDFIDKSEGLEKGVRKAEAIQERITNKSEEPLSPLGKGELQIKVNKAKNRLIANQRMIEKFERAKELRSRLEEIDTAIGDETELLNTGKSELGRLRKEQGDRLDKRLSKEYDDQNKPELFEQEAPKEGDLIGKRTKHSQRLIDKARNDLVEKVNVMYQDRNNFAVIIPGAREQAFFNRGSQPGTVWGEAARFFAQFKTFPLAVYTKPIERDILSGGASSVKQGIKEGFTGGENGGDLIGVAGFMGGMTFYGGLGVMANDFFNGKTQRDWTTVEPYIESAIAGGGFGLYSSTVLGHYGSGANFQSGLNAFGPVAGDVPDILSLTFGAFNGEPKARKALDFLHGYTPTQNIFYSKAIWDYLLFYNMQEAIDPGSLDRMQRAIKKGTEQDFFKPPSDVIPSGGGNPLTIAGKIFQ